MNSAIWKTFFIVLVLLQFTAALSNFATLVSAAGSVEILSHTGYLDSSGNYRVVGEVQNAGTQAVNFIQVTATFYDSQNSVVDSRFDLTMLNVLLVQRKSPFEIALLDVAESSRVNHYSLNVTFLEASSIPMKLAIFSDSSHLDTDGSMHIIGNLKNLGDQTLVNAKVVATYYDQSSRVVAASSEGFDPELTGEITPNRTVSFELILSKERAQYAATYALAAESNQYSLIPEVPGNIVLTLLIVSSFLGILANRSKTKRTHAQGII